MKVYVYLELKECESGATSVLRNEVFSNEKAARAYCLDRLNTFREKHPEWKFEQANEESWRCDAPAATYSGEFQEQRLRESFDPSL